MTCNACTTQSKKNRREFGAHVHNFEDTIKVSKSVAGKVVRTNCTPFRASVTFADITRMSADTFRDTALVSINTIMVLSKGRVLSSVDTSIDKLRCQMSAAV